MSGRSTGSLGPHMTPMLSRAPKPSPSAHVLARWPQWRILRVSSSARPPTASWVRGKDGPRCRSRQDPTHTRHVVHRGCSVCLVRLCAVGCWHHQSLAAYQVDPPGHLFHLHRQSSWFPATQSGLSRKLGDLLAGFLWHLPLHRTCAFYGLALQCRRCEANNALERTVKQGPRLAAARSWWPAVQRNR
jgi:hypothetical protein